jgi:phenylalanyl-tRNA synthetase beta chain
MKLPLSWLRDYVDINDTPARIAERLTFSGTEVAAIETIGSTYEGLVVGEVRSVEKHPNADKLTLCRVYDGRDELQVVCGAPNVQTGGKYPFAPIGASLPATSLTIKKAKLRGVESFGMLCSEVELGISENHSGLMSLDAKWTAGTALADVLGPPETVLELEVTPNRPDCLSLIGIARELAALYKKTLKIPDISGFRSQVSGFKGDARVNVEDPDGCPRYTARILKNVKIGPAPAWMQKRLQLAGIRAINNVVDITNYVLLECGQPLHAFDQTLLKDGRIIVRRSRDEETITTLDGIERKLTPAMLVIADAARPVALAGIMGGAGSEINESTSTVLLESAFFKPSLIRATSKKLGLSSESSYRFERGVDIGQVEWASRRAADLMVEHAGAVVVGDVIDVYPTPAATRKIACRFDRVRSVLGVEATNDEIESVLQSLELGVEAKDSGGCAIRVPTFRMDLEHEIDLVEEFARIYGLDRIPAPLPRAQFDAGGNDEQIKAVQELRARLVGLGLREITNYSLLSEALLNLFDPSDTDRRIVLPRPINADQTILRTSLIPQMVETLGRNRAHQVDESAFFELGRVFEKDGSGKPIEHDRLTIGLMGPTGRGRMDRRRPVEPEEIFLWAKGIWENLVSVQRIEDWSLTANSHPYFEGGFSLSLRIGDKPAGSMGLVHHSIRKDWRLADPVAVLDVALSPLLEHAMRSPSFAAIAPYPCIVRDMALVVDEPVRHENITQIIRTVAPPELEKIELFDIYRGKSIGAGRKSMAYSLTYRSATRTLTDEEANGYHNIIKEALRRELHADIREG